MVVNQMEYPRALKESIIRDVRSYADYNYLEIVKSASDPKLGVPKFIATVVKKELDSRSTVYVPPNFPIMLADILRSEDLSIVPMQGILEKARETKEAEEVNEIKNVQTVVENVTTEIIDVIANSDVNSSGTLMGRVEGKKQPLTVGTIKSLFGHRFLDAGCVMDEEIIIACGPRGADPHYFGNPRDELKANQPIVMDIFPRNLRGRYLTDMTRTIVKGKASKEVRKMFETVLAAKNQSIEALKAGVLGCEAYSLCCNVLESAGFATTQGGNQIWSGFLHSLGHGVGLQIHEGPALSELATLPLEEHNIVTVEPGLYDPTIGGVRIEDIVEITETGCNNFTTMEITLEI
jgi:Xaa-Pro aminopeptidase